MTNVIQTKTVKYVHDISVFAFIAMFIFLYATMIITIRKKYKNYDSFVKIFTHSVMTQKKANYFF